MPADLRFCISCNLFIVLPGNIYFSPEIFPHGFIQLFVKMIIVCNHHHLWQPSILSTDIPGSAGLVFSSIICSAFFLFFLFTHTKTKNNSIRIHRLPTICIKLQNVLMVLQLNILFFYFFITNLYRQRVSNQVFKMIGIRVKEIEFNSRYFIATCFSRYESIAECFGSCQLYL